MPNLDPVTLTTQAGHTISFTGPPYKMAATLRIPCPACGCNGTASPSNGPGIYPITCHCGAQFPVAMGFDVFATSAMS